MTYKDKKCNRLALTFGANVARRRQLMKMSQAEVNIMANSLAEMLAPLPSSKQEELVSLIEQLVRILHDKD